jgi:hypothetical protein
VELLPLLKSAQLEAERNHPGEAEHQVRSARSLYELTELKPRSFEEWITLIQRLKDTTAKRQFFKIKPPNFHRFAPFTANHRSRSPKSSDLRNYRIPAPIGGR